MFVRVPKVRLPKPKRTKLPYHPELARDYHFATRTTALGKAPSGRLVHRVREAYVIHRRMGRDSSSYLTSHADWYCSGSVRYPVLLTKVSEMDVLCARCESAAVTAGEKPISELLGVTVTETHCLPGTGLRITGSTVTTSG